jgi:hypothetical protein
VPEKSTTVDLSSGNLISMVRRPLNCPSGPAGLSRSLHRPTDQLPDL